MFNHDLNSIGTILMRKFLTTTALAGAIVAVLPSFGSASGRPYRYAPGETISGNPSNYSNGYGTNAANSTAVGRPVDANGGYVVNQYGFGNYVSGPEGFGGYPAGSAGAEIWRQRERWKCENAPESC